MDKLNAKNMLPALFVSNDHDILETYHQKVADLLQERYEPLIKKVTLENKQREKELSKLSNIEREKVERDGGARVFNPEFGMMGACADYLPRHDCVCSLTSRDC